MSAKDPPHSDSANRPSPTTRRSLQPPPAGAPVTPLPPSGPPSSRKGPSSQPVTPAPSRPNVPFAPPPFAPPPSLGGPPHAPHAPWLSQDAPPPSTRSTSIPPPSSSQTPHSTKSTLPASVQKALVTLDKVKAKLETMERQKTEPIAVIGMACRFPAGASTPEAFFQKLESGVDAITRVSSERWGEGALDSQTPRWGAFLTEDVAMFDAAFFGISPREAERLDPQQRLLLEMTWEAMERAGILPTALSGTRTGVFLGLMTTDYMLLSMEAPADSWDMYTATGSAHCFPAGRLSYSFGFQGPAMVVDTACSSSLVAVHLACQSLRAGESEVAVAGGMNLMLSPAMFEMTAKTNALAPDGRCKTFDARADGYVRGEGGGVLLLKRLSEAQRDGDPILALIRGSAVNQDGRSTGLTTPNVLSQQAMLRQALESARVTGAEIGYVEAHGTGTSLGDPIEFEALRAVLGGPREDGPPCVLGAVKTNIGHLEAAAGVAGLVKTIQVLRNELIPRNLHLRALNPRMSLEGTPFVLPTENRPWERGEKPRIAGVSSFGLSGTNAHVLLEEAPPENVEDSSATPVAAALVPISAKSPEALLDFSRSFAAALSAPSSAALQDVSHTACLRRTHHEHRVTVVGSSRSEIASALTTFLKEGSAPGVYRAKASPPGRQKIIFVFPGQGSQWIGMGRQLLREEPAFRSTIELCHEAIRRHGTFSLLDEIAADEDTSRMNDIDVVQPMIFAIQVALVALWQHWGVEPEAVIGHSMGEVAAARAAGILTIEEAAKVVCRRSRCLTRIAGQGAMAQVELPPEEADRAIAPFRSELAVAVKNGPRSTVLSGDPIALDAVLRDLEGRGVYCRRIKVDVASHSPQVDVLKEDLAAVLFNLRPRSARIPMFSTATGEILRGPELTAEYWVKNLRDPVQFAPVMTRMLDDRQALFVEIGPHPVLLNPIEENLREARHDGAAIGSMRRGADERRSMLEALGALHARGAAIDWKRTPAAKGRHTQLPAYPFQRKRFWIQDVPPPAERAPRRSAPPRSMPTDWMLTPQWIAAEPPTAAARAAAGPLLVLSDRSGAGDALCRELRARGVPCVRALAGQRTAQIEPGLWELDATDPAAYPTVLRDAFDAETPCRGVVHLFGLDARDPQSAEEIERAQTLGAESVLLLAQALVRADEATPPSLWLVTRGVAALSNGPNVSVAQAPVWGLGRTIQGEHADLATRLVDLPEASFEGETSALLAEILHDDGEDQVALRRDERFVARLARGGAAVSSSAPALRQDGTYLLTGGLGGLGVSFAEWMVGRGARHLVLAGRSAPSPAAQEAIARMEAAGARVMVASADIGVGAEAFALVARIAQEMPPLRGVIHAAAVLDDHTLGKLTVTSMRDVAAAKMYGAWHLHLATRSAGLELFVLFSSAASLLGSMGQGNYAAANAFLDALAAKRRVEGLPALSIAWGPFSEVGLAAARANRGERLSAMGLRNIAPAQGHEILGSLLAGSPPVVGVLEIDVNRARDSMPRLGTAPYFALLRGAASAPQKEAPAGEARLLEQVRRAPPAERRAALQRVVREELARVMRLDPALIEITQPFAQHGFDSLMGLELRNRLQSGFALALSMADIVTHTRVDALADLLHERLSLDAGGDDAPRPSSRAEKPPGSWVVVPRPSATARARLFCFPYAGGAAPVFSGWPADLPPEIEVCAIQPPGRHERLHEPLLESVDAMVASLVPALLPLLDKPFAVFGHCLGAIVMFETLRTLAEKHGKKPIHVFASAAPAPHRYLVPTVAALSQNDFADVLRSIGFADENVLLDQDAQEHMMPAVKADFDVAARYAFSPRSALDAPITAFAGLDDAFAPIDLVDEWRSETTSRFAKIALPGGHYFIVPERAAVLAHVREEVLHRLAALEQAEPSRATVTGIEPWLTRVAPREAPAGRLVCFPGLGEAALDSAAWGRAFDDDVEVLAVELPGHGSRVGELPLGRVDEIAALLARVMPAIGDRPFAFAGSDLGALVAFEVARLLEQEGLATPQELVIVSAMAPDLHYFAPIHHLGADRFAAELKKLGISGNRLSDRALRADCAALSTYARAVEKVGVPIKALAGELDWFVPLGGVRGWGRFTSGAFTFETRRGGHTLDDRGRAALAAALRQRIGRRAEG